MKTFFHGSDDPNALATASSGSCATGVERRDPSRRSSCLVNISIGGPDNNHNRSINSEYFWGGESFGTAVGPMDLEGMTARALMRRAEDMGIDETALEAADEAALRGRMNIHFSKVRVFQNFLFRKQKAS